MRVKKKPKKVQEEDVVDYEEMRKENETMKKIIATREEELTMVNQINTLENTGQFRYYLLNNLVNIKNTLKNIGLALNKIGQVLEEKETESEDESEDEDEEEDEELDEEEEEDLE